MPMDERPKRQEKECVEVVLRCRPMNKKEIDDGNLSVIEVDEQLGSIRVIAPDDSSQHKTFTYDTVFNSESTQQGVYDEIARPIVNSVMEGYNGTIFAYGQTGTGKTYTMEGSEGNKGIIPRAFDQIFQEIENSGGKKKYLVRCSFLEIYKEQIRDLLSNDLSRNLEIKESVDSGIFVKNLTQIDVTSAKEIFKCLKKGTSVRVIGDTKLNEQSSRSHCIFTVIVEVADKSDILGDEGVIDGGIDADCQQQQQQHIRVGKLNMVDLAGSERQAKSGAIGMRLMEAAQINLSLSALGNVIYALTNSRTTHIPYRDSKLTRLLQDSLGGNTKTVMIANIGPSAYNYDETVTTLRFASRAKKIENKPIINEDPKDTMLKQYQDEINALRKRLLECPKQEHDFNITQSVTPIIVDKVVEKIVKKKGISEKKVRALEKRAEEKKKLITETMLKEMAEIDALTTKAEEKARGMSKQLREKAEILEVQKQERERLERHLQEMEHKLITGHKVAEEIMEQESLLLKKKRELKATQKEKLRLERQLQKREEFQLEISEKVDSQEKELQMKINSLKVLRQKYRETMKEIGDVQIVFQQEREELLEMTRDLSRELLLKQTIVDHFVSPSALQELTNKIVWNEQIGLWQIVKPNFHDLIAIPRPISSRPRKKISNL